MLNINFIENIQRLKQEVTHNWKPGAVMISVALVVGQVYGRVAGFGVILFTLPNYDMISRQMRTFSWMSLKRVLFVVVVFGGNGYFNLVSPQLMGYLAGALVLIDNFQLANINADLEGQKKTVDDNNKKLEEVYANLKTLETELTKLVKPAAELKEAKDENTKAVEVVIEIVPNYTIELPGLLTNLNTLINELRAQPETKELLELEADLDGKIRAMLREFDGLSAQLPGLRKKVEDVSAKMEKNVMSLEQTITLERRHIDALNEFCGAGRRYLELKGG